MGTRADCVDSASEERKPRPMWPELKSFHLTTGELRENKAKLAACSS